MSTPRTFPPEIFIRVIELSSPLQPTIPSNDLYHCYSTLRTYCLVSWDWYAIAKRELLSVVLLERISSLKSATSTTFTSEWVKQLRIEPRYGHDADWGEFRSLIRKCVNVEDLRVRSVINLNVQDLGCLKNLRSLTLQDCRALNVWKSDVDQQSSLHLPFLSQLTLRWIRRSPEALAALLSPRVLPRLRALAVTQYQADRISGAHLADNIRSLAPQLDILCLDPAHSPSQFIPLDIECPVIYDALVIRELSPPFPPPTSFRHLVLREPLLSSSNPAPTQGNTFELVQSILDSFPNLGYLLLNSQRRKDFPSSLVEGRGVKVEFEAESEVPVMRGTIPVEFWELVKGRRARNHQT